MANVKISELPVDSALSGTEIVPVVDGSTTRRTTTQAIANLKDVSNLVVKETGKGLSTEDYTTAEKTKLSGIAANATANDTDANLKNRANHTGTQTSATIADLTEYIQDTIAAMLGAGSNVILNYNDAEGTLEVSATGSGGAGLDAEQVRDAIGVALVGVGNIAITVNDAADTITISSTATQNSTDAALRDRSTHTGTQTASTISDFSTAVNALLGSYATDADLIAAMAQIDADKADVVHTHAAADITESTTRRFVTDTEKSTWNGKQDTLPSQTGNSGKVLGTNGTSLSWVTQSGGSGSSAIIPVDASGTDNRAAIQAAINSIPVGGGEVFLKPGTHYVSKDGSNNYGLLVPNNVVIRGAGLATRIAGTSTTAHTIMIKNGSARVENTAVYDVYFNPTVDKAVEYAEIYVSGGIETRIDKVHFGRPNGSNTGGTTTDESKVGGFIICDASINVFISSVTGFGAKRFLEVHTSSVDIFVTQCFVDMNYSTAVAMYLHDTVEAVVMTNVDVVNSQFEGSGTTLKMENNVNACSFTNVLFDTHGTGVDIVGNCKGNKFIGCWTSSRPNHGVIMRANGGGSPVGTILNSCTFALSGKEGVRIEAGKFHKVINCEFAHSGYSTSGLSCLYVGATVSQVLISGNTGTNTGWSGRLPAGGANKGVHIEPGATKIIVDQNDLSEYLTGFYSDANVVYGELNLGVIDKFAATGGASFLDEFTGSAGALNTHTANTGHAWTRVNPATGHGLFLSGTGTMYSAAPSGQLTTFKSNFVPTSANQQYSLTYDVKSSVGEVGMWARYSSTSESNFTGYMARMSGTKIQLFKAIAGAFTQLGSDYMHTAVTGDVITLAPTGTSIVVKLNGTAIITQTDNSITAAGTVAIVGDDGAGSPTTGIHITKIESN